MLQPPPLLSAPFGSFRAEATKPRSRPRCEDEAGPQSLRAGSRSGGKGAGGGSARVRDRPRLRRAAERPVAGQPPRLRRQCEDGREDRAGLGRPRRRMPPRACVPGLIFLLNGRAPASRACDAAPMHSGCPPRARLVQHSPDPPQRAPASRRPPSLRLPVAESDLVSQVGKDLSLPLAATGQVMVGVKDFALAQLLSWLSAHVPARCAAAAQRIRPCSTA